MNRASALPEFLTAKDRESITDLFGGIEILPLSCLLYESDEFKTISDNRILPDDFIYVPRKGILRCTVGDVSREVGPGHFIMVSAGQRHGVTMAEGTDSYEVFALHMHAVDANGHRFFDKLATPFGFLADQALWFKKLAACTHLLGCSHPMGKPFFRQAVTWLLYEQLMHGNRLRPMPVKQDIRITRILGRVRENCAAAWTVTRMAQLCNLSTGRFQQLFRKCTGTSPKRFVLGVRLAQARALLATQPDLSVSDIAVCVGMPDTRHFHHAYRDAFGKTPRGKP
jgi:AraC-like DNA-binding protein